MGEKLVMTEHRIQVRDLQVGDVLVGSGRRVTAAPTSGAHTPSGKCDLGVRSIYNPHHGAKLVTWGKYTRVTVERPS